MSLEAQLNWTRNMQFIGRAGEAPAVILDNPEGGSGSSPMQLVLMGVAGCSAMDVVSILKKKRSTFTGLAVHIKGDRNEGHPKRFTDVHMEFKVSGQGVKAADVERAIDLSQNKYCSVTASLNADVKYEYEIKEN